MPKRAINGSGVLLTIFHGAPARPNRVVSRWRMSRWLGAWVGVLALAGWLPTAVAQSPDGDAMLSDYNRTLLPMFGRAIGGNLTKAIGRRMHAPVERILGDEDSFAAAVMQHALPVAPGVRLAEGLDGSRLVMPLAATDEGATRTNARTNAITLWGEFNWLNLDGDADADDDPTTELTPWEGDLLSLYMGADTRLAGGGLLGLAVARNRGEVNYIDADDGGSGGDDDGGVTDSYALTMTSVHPYVSWHTGGNSTGWATAGYGTGEVRTTATRETREVLMQTVGLGVSGRLAGDDTTQINITGELSHTQFVLEEDPLDSTRPEMRLAGQELRLNLARTSLHATSGGGVLSPRVAAGIYYAAGDGQAGAAFEFNNELHYTSAGRGATGIGTIHAILGDNYKQWGVSGAVDIGRNGGRGLVFSLQPSWGAGDVGDWTGAGSTPTPLANRLPPRTARLDLELGYGIGRAGLLMTPYSAIAVADDANRYRLGLRWEKPNLQLQLHGEQHDGAGHSLRLQGRIGL